MYFISTRGGERVTGAQAIVQGLAKNGGLYVPETFPTISNEELEIGYLYDDGNGSIEQKLNSIRSALGLKHRELDNYWEGDDY